MRAHTRGPLSVSLISELTCGSAWIWLWWLLTGSRNCFLLSTLYSPLFSCFSSLWPTRCLASGSGYSWLLKSLVTPSSAPLHWTDNTNGLSLYRWSSCRLQEEHFLKKSLFFFSFILIKVYQKKRRENRGKPMPFNQNWVGGAKEYHWPLTFFAGSRGHWPINYLRVLVALSLSHAHILFFHMRTNKHALLHEVLLLYLLVRLRTVRWAPPWSSWGSACCQTCGGGPGWRQSLGERSPVDGDKQTVTHETQEATFSLWFDSL